MTRSEMIVTASAENDAAAERRAKHHHRFVAIHLGLIEIDHVERRDQEDRHHHRRGDQTGADEYHDEGEPQKERPPELVDLPVSEVREQRREDRRLRHVLAGMCGKVLRTLLCGDAVVSQSLMRAAVGAEDGGRNLLAAVVARHRLDPPRTAVPRASLSVAIRYGPAHRARSRRVSSEALWPVRI